MRVILENISRHGSIGGAAAIGGLVVGMRLLPRRFATTPAMAPAIDLPRVNPTAFIAVDVTGVVTIEAHRSEMGPEINTGFLMAAADELEAEWSRVCGPQAVGDNAVCAVAQNTGGSYGMSHLLQPVRQMGAAVRQMLETAAAVLWGVDVTQVHARNHQIVHTSTGRVLGYGEVATVARALQVPRLETLRLKKRGISACSSGRRPSKIV
jgi:isoquinoline 1-oxidoreductase subunit beta